MKQDASTNTYNLTSQRDIHKHDIIFSFEKLLLPIQRVLQFWFMLSGIDMISYLKRETLLMGNIR